MSWPNRIITAAYGILLAFLPLFFLPNTSELFEFNKVILLYLGTVVIVCAWIYLMIQQKRIIFRRTSADLPILIFLLIQFVSLLFSLDIRTSWLGYYSRFNGGLLSLICYSLLYWGAATHLPASRHTALLRWLIISAVTVCTWGILEHFGIDASWWVQDVQNRVFSTLGQPNWLAAVIVALIFIPLSSLVSSHLDSRPLPWWHLMAFGVLFITLIFTKSRSGLLAFAVCLALFWLGANYLRRLRPLPSRWWIWVLGINLILGLLTFTLDNPVKDKLFPPVTPQTLMGPALETGGTESGTIRQIVWQGAIAIWQGNSKQFWLGTGPETFAMAYYRYRPLAHNATSEWDLLYNKAHNEYLNFLSTTGLLGLISYLWLLGSFALIFWRFLRTAAPESRWPVLALACGWLSLLITNFWGFSVVAGQIYLFVFPALALPVLPPPSALFRSRSWPGLILVSLLGGFLIFSILRYWLADIHYAAGQKSLRLFSLSSTRDPQYIVQGYQELAQAYQLNPADAAIVSEFSNSSAYLSLALSVSDATTAAQMAQLATFLADRSVALSPSHPNFYKYQARTFIILATMDPKYFVRADAALAAAQPLSPTDPRLPYQRGVIARYRQDYQAANQYISQALALKPDFAEAKTEAQFLATVSAHPATR